MSVFGQAKDLMKMRTEAKKLQQALGEELIEVAADGENILLTISADQKIREVKLTDAAKSNPNLETLLQKAFNKAIETSQKIAAEKMKAMGGFPGLGM